MLGDFLNAVLIVICTVCIMSYVGFIGRKIVDAISITANNQKAIHSLIHTCKKQIEDFTTVTSVHVTEPTREPQTVDSRAKYRDPNTGLYSMKAFRENQSKKENGVFDVEQI